MSGTHLVRIAEALSRPLLFHPTKLEVILSALDGRLPGFEVPKPGPESSRFVGRREGDRPYRQHNGIGFVPVVGSLANRGAYVGASSGVTTYEGLATQFRMLAADDSIHSVVIDLDTPGGEATGMFRLAAQMRQLRQSKRVVAFVDDMAASAGYGIASQAHEIVVSPTSIVGSIGVVLAHVDRQAEMEKAGRKVTLIHAGAHKVDGNPFGPLSEAVLADLQAEVLNFYSQFLATVAAGRPALGEEKAKATEARTFLGQAAIDAGLADRIGTLDSVVSDLITRASGRQRSTRGFSMSSSNNAPAAFSGVQLTAAITACLAAGGMDATGILAAFAAAGAPCFTQAQIDAARAEGTAQAAAGNAEAVAAAATAERERIAGIVNCEEAKERGPQALATALSTALSVDQARAVLAASPKASGRSSLQERMENRTELTLDPDKGAGAEAEAKKAERAKALDPSAIYGARRAAPGK